MHRHWFDARTIAVTLALAVPFSMGRVPSAGAGGGGRPVWQVVPSPNAGQDVNDVVGVEAISGTDVWTVGFRRNASLAYRTLTQHFDGTAWHIVPSPNSGASDNFLAGVAAISPGDAWAVGRFFDGSSLRTLAEHWNGSAWAVVPTPNGSLQNSDLTSVAAVAPDDVWAVGSTNTLSTYRPLAIHWNGSSWTTVPTTGSGLFLAATAIDTNDVWAVGATKPEGVTLTQHWNGSSWTVVSSPNGPGDNQLSGVSAVATNDVWAVGTQAEGTRTLGERWNGTVWQIVPTPNPEPGNQGNSVLAAVTALSSTDAWAVGLTIDFPSGSLEQTLTERWNGSSWTVVPSPSPGTGSATLVAASSLADHTVWAVGAKHVSATPYDRTLTIRTTVG